MRYRLFSIIALLSLSLLSCDSDDMNFDTTSDDFEENAFAIINGKRVADGDHASTVALLIDGSAFCTGTLISPNTVLTAGHCVADCDEDMSYYRANMKIGFGNSENNIKKTYKVSNSWAHPKFVCNEYDIQNDIAIIRLAQDVPSSVASPALLIPSKLIPTKNEIDNGKVEANSVGFGLTNPNNDYSSGTKYETTWPVSAICSNNGGPNTGYCSWLISQGFSKGFMYFFNEETNICSGDSGGSTFVTRDGKDYLIGVHSFGDQFCSQYAGMTYIPDYRDFIEKYAQNLPSAETKSEICDNGKDDNGNGKVDCDDPDCTTATACMKEICNNGIDDNGNGKVDCNDPDCTGAIQCVPEDCNNGIDDNDDGNIDCDDPQCRLVQKCQPEDCSNGIDDNDDGLIDCEDVAACSNHIHCKVEDCINGIDDNGNGLFDCEDPQCADSYYCLPEDCTNGIDDNGDGLIDCNDAKCFGTPICMPENCTNGVDDNGDGLADCVDPKCKQDSACMAAPAEICGNYVDDDGNGLVDCEDPACSAMAACQPVVVKSEICGNDLDDDGNGLVDCDDPACLALDACSKSSSNSDSSCSALPNTPSSGSPWLLVFAAIAAAFGYRRKRGAL